MKTNRPGSAVAERLARPARKTGADASGDFMQVVLNGVPSLSAQASPPPVDQVEVFLPNGTRLVVTGEKSMGLIRSILKNR